MEKVNEYIKAIPSYRIDRFNELLNIIGSWYPEAELTMHYNMPTYKIDKNWIAVANQKSYVSVYTCAYEHIESYVKKYPDTKHGTGCLNFRDKDKIYFDDLKRVAESALTSKKNKG